MFNNYQTEKHMMITFALVAALLIIGLIFLVGNNNNVSGQELNTTKQQFLEQIEEQVNDTIEKDLNITDIENYSEQELRMKIFIWVCNNPEKHSTWIEIEPEVLKYQCDVAMKILRDRGLIDGTK